MLVVCASRLDAIARTIVQHWSARGAALLTSEDLSQPGWRLFPGNSAEGTAVVSGACVPIRDIDGVLVRRSYVFQEELGYVAAQDRAYVAAEMTAFLRAWLVTLRCPVVNPPSHASLSGPNWSAQQWNYAARRAGARVNALHVSSHATDVALSPSERNAVVVTVVGSRCLSRAPEHLTAIARRLAAIGRTPLLAVHFSSQKHATTFLRADPFPAIEDDGVADVVQRTLFANGRQQALRVRHR